MADGLSLSVARNAWATCVLQIDCAQLPKHPTLLLPSFGDIQQTAFEVLPTPTNTTDAESVRQTGNAGQVQAVPRVLLPLPMNDRSVDLATMRDPANPADANAHPNQGTVLVWIDLHIPNETPAGNLHGTVQLLNGDSKQSIGGLPIHLTIENLTLPAEPHLHFAAPLEWSTLNALFPQVFGPVAPRLIDKNDPRQGQLLKIVDDYLQLAHANRVDLFVPRFQPIVKWPLGTAPSVDWDGFDSVVAGYMNGSAFPNHVAAAFWPLPAPDSLAEFDLATRVQYWHQAANHFDRNHWLDRSPVMLGNDSPQPVNEAESILLCSEARQILASHPRITTLLPLRQDQIQLVSSGNSVAISPDSTARLLTLLPGLVYTPPAQPWPAGAAAPRQWIDTAGHAGLFATTGTAEEQNVRTLGWLAYALDATLVLCDNAVPAVPAQPVDTDQLPLLYPGQLYGVDYPLATIQLKWIRQAEQDYEYLTLAKAPADRQAALRMCRFITKPVQLKSGQSDLPLYDLLTGTTDPHASEEAIHLLAGRLQRATTAGATVDQVEVQTVRWFNQRQHPTVVATANHWSWQNQSLSNPAQQAGNWLDALIDVDLYNPAEETAGGNQLQWLPGAGGWEADSAPDEVAALMPYQVQHATARARFNLNQITDESRSTIELKMIDGYTGQSVPCKVEIPVATSERLNRSVQMDGKLTEWFPADAVQLNQPLVRMFDRSTLQAQELQFADVPASIYTAWSDDNFYVAFRLSGVATADLRSTRNFVQYDCGRAWGEDLCELLIQPLYIDNTLGPILHIVCKPGGNWVEQKTQSGKTWDPFEASGVRYASGVDPAEKIWRGEVAIPWKAIAAMGHGRPGLLRFNFIQHQQSNAQSASWAGQIDESRNADLMGLLVVKEP